MILVNATPFYDIHNSGWVYLGVDDSGNYWIRSVRGAWASIPSPAQTQSIIGDFAAFFQTSQAVPLAQVNADDEAAVVDQVAQVKAQ